MWYREPIYGIIFVFWWVEISKFKMAAIYQFHFFCFEAYNPYYLLNFTRETRFQQYVFISWYHFLYFDEPNQTSKFKMATSGQIENLTPKKIVLETGIISLFPLIIAHRAHFWHHLCILTGLNVKTQDGRHLSFPLFSDLSHSIHCYCWMWHQKLVSSNICWFYVLLLHIFRSFWIGFIKWIAITMTEVVNLLICMFIMVLYVSVSFLIDMLVY